MGAPCSDATVRLRTGSRQIVTARKGKPMAAGKTAHRAGALKERGMDDHLVTIGVDIATDRFEVMLLGWSRGECLGMVDWALICPHPDHPPASAGPSWPLPERG